MKKYKAILVIMLSLVLIFQLNPIIGKAAAVDNKDYIVLTEERTKSEKEILKGIYAELYPNEYHYIEEYEINGVREMNEKKITVVFNGSKQLNDTIYDLLVMSNGQVFTNYSTILDTTKAGTTTGSFTVGDIGHYTTFNITYTINTSGYDKINSCNHISGSGFYLYPTNLSKKMTENAAGPAHYGYNNVSMNYDGSGVLYDIGVGVGKDKAKGIAQISTGADMWLWAFIYAFFFS